MELESAGRKLGEKNKNEDKKESVTTPVEEFTNETGEEIKSNSELSSVLSDEDFDNLDFLDESDYSQEVEFDKDFDENLKLLVTVIVKKVLMKKLTKKFREVKKLIEKRNKAVRMKFDGIEKVKVDMTNIQEVFKSYLERRFQELDEGQVKNAQEINTLKDEMSDLVTTSVVHNRSLAKVTKTLQEDKVRIDNIELQCSITASKVDTLENNMHDVKFENLNDVDVINIPDEPSRVTVRRKVKSRASDTATSPITDTEETPSTRDPGMSDKEITIEDLQASIADLKECWEERALKGAKKKRVSISRSSSPPDPSASSSDGSDSEQEKKPKRGRKKKRRDDSSSGDDSSVESEGSDVTRGIAALNRDRRSSVFKDLEGDEDHEVPYGRGRRNAIGSEVLTLKNLPTMKDLYLDTLSVPNLLKFAQKYQTLQQNYFEPLKIANYFKHTILNRVENVARRGKYKEKLRRKGILSNGRQRLSNSQIWAVIKYIVAPRNTEEMKNILRVSVFDVEKFAQYKSEAYIHDHFEEYVNELVNYDKQFLAMLDLATGTKAAKEALPHQVNGGSGKFGQKEKGLVQYFLQGHPNPEFAWRMYTRHSKEKERLNVKTFDDFRELYFKCLDKLEELIRVEKLSANTFGKEADNTEAKPPRDIRKQNRFRQGSKHAVNAAVEEDEYDKVEDEFDHSEDETRSDGVIEEDEADSKPQGVKSGEESEEVRVEETSEEDWLHGMSFDPAGKRPPVCFKFADTNTCEYGAKCVYSHNSDDVKAYKAAKLLGPARVGNISNQYAQRSGKDSHGQHKSQPGARKSFDKPTGILRRSQDARNNA